MNTYLTNMPQLSPWRSIVFMALTTLIMAYSVNIGMVSILVFYAMWFSHGYYKGKFTLYPGPEMFLPLLLASYAALSFVWSDYPNESLYKGTEFVSMMLCTFIMVRVNPIDTFLKGLALGCIIIMIITLLSGNSGMPIMGPHAHLMGYFSSKNQVGLFAEIGIISVVSLLCFPARNLIRFALYLPAIALYLGCLYLSKSGSSILSLIMVLAVLGGVLFLTRLPLNARPVFIAVALLGAITALFATYAFNLGIYQKILGALGKDSTLTGRTYLWKEGIINGFDDPVLGHGYSAFWVLGQPKAEQYWKEFFITTKTGFHFHNMYIQSFVDLGLLGLLMILFMAGRTFFVSFYRCAFQDKNMVNIFALSLSTMFIIRGIVEVDILGPFGIGCLLFTYMFASQYKRNV
jgi:exopolysaccharide production protein ExoQ